MAPHSSQSSSAPSPSLKRKQATISSFFTQKPSSTPQTAYNDSRTVPDSGSKKRPASPAEPDHDLNQADPIPEDEDEEDIVVPPPKRARTNGSATEEPKQPSRGMPLTTPSQLSSSQRTDIFTFQSSPAVAPTAEEEDGPAEAQRKKEREKLHQKFVRKLGGPDCLIGIGRSAAREIAAAAEAEEGEEDDEPAPPPPTKGKGAPKKGGSKLTPMEKQVIEIKRKHMDTVLVIEVGYKFRFFGEDARIAAKELGIVCIPGRFRFDERELLVHREKTTAMRPKFRLQTHPKLISTVLPLPVFLCTGCMYTSSVSLPRATKWEWCDRSRRRRLRLRAIIAMRRLCAN